MKSKNELTKEIIAEVRNFIQAEWSKAVILRGHDPEKDKRIELFVDRITEMKKALK